MIDGANIVQFKTSVATPLSLAEEEIARLKTENERLRAALAIYADHENWFSFSEEEDAVPVVWAGGGMPQETEGHGWDVAEAALGEKGETTPES